MNITNDCIECIKDQINKACNTLGLNENLKKEINLEVLKKSKTFDLKKSPPFVAKEVYELLAEKTQLIDPLEKIKQESIKEALIFVPFVEDKISESSDKLFTAIKAAVAGNVIDFASKEQFTLENEIKKIFDKDFAINDFKLFLKILENNNELLILSDNAGENVFDKILIKTLKSLYPKLSITYATRGKAIINDITVKEALQIGIDKYAKVVSSGVPTPGLELDLASDEFKSLYHQSPLILAKGMGNFECLEDTKDKRIFFLFKVKCNVVSKHIKEDVGEIIFKRA
ncbi:MAG: DUF89 family protein [Campylobacteraceae bacterium]|nr:DUF89 family protein [Campylobacteraceae bacterium]